MPAPPGGYLTLADDLALSRMGYGAMQLAGPGVWGPPRLQAQPAFRDRERDRHIVLDILDWLWDRVTGPVLTVLGHVSPPEPGTTWPRIW